MATLRNLAIGALKRKDITTIAAAFRRNARSRSSASRDHKRASSDHAEAPPGAATVKAFNELARACLAFRNPGLLRRTGRTLRSGPGAGGGR